MNHTKKEVLDDAIEALEGFLPTKIHWEAYECEDDGDGDIGLFNTRFPITIRHNVSQTPAAILITDLFDRGLAKPVLVTEFVNPKLAKALRHANQEYFDTAGNVFINRPGLHVLVVGQKNNWDRTGVVIDTNAAFEPAGLKVVFCFLVNPELINQPYRKIAEVTGAAVGTVGRVINGLEAGRLITRKSKGDGTRAILQYKTLFDRWLNAYATKLVHKIDLGTFYIDRKNWTPDLDVWRYQGQWGGETAAEKYTNYMKPQEHTLFIPKENKRLFVNDFRGRKYDPFVDKTKFIAVRLKEKFWTLKNEGEYVNPVLVYADLLATDDARNIDTAGELYDQYIRPRFE